MGGNGERGSIIIDAGPWFYLGWPQESQNMTSSKWMERIWNEFPKKTRAVLSGETRASWI